MSDSERCDGEDAPSWFGDPYAYGDPKMSTDSPRRRLIFRLYDWCNQDFSGKDIIEEAQELMNEAARALQSEIAQTNAAAQTSPEAVFPVGSTELASAAPSDDKGECPKCGHENGGHYQTCESSYSDKRETPRTDAAQFTIPNGDDSTVIWWTHRFAYMLKHARQLELELNAARSAIAPTWRSVKDDPPPDRQYVLVAGYQWGDPRNPRLLICASRHGGTWYSGEIADDLDECWTPTHWMPLPVAPSDSRSESGTTSTNGNKSESEKQ